MKSAPIPPPSAEIAGLFARYPEPIAARLDALRALIYTTARRTEGAGRIAESLKWGQASFATVEPKSGSPVRLDAHKNGTDVAVYFVCTTGLVDGFRQRYGDVLRFETNRAILLAVDEPVPQAQLSHCLALAMTYFVKR